MSEDEKIEEKSEIKPNKLKQKFIDLKLKFKAFAFKVKELFTKLFLSLKQKENLTLFLLALLSISMCKIAFWGVDGNMRIKGYVYTDTSVSGNVDVDADVSGYMSTDTSVSGTVYSKINNIYPIDVNIGR